MPANRKQAPKLVDAVSSFGAANTQEMGQSKSGWWSLAKKADLEQDISQKRNDNVRLKKRTVVNKAAFDSVVIEHGDGELPNQYEAPLSKTAQ